MAIGQPSNKKAWPPNGHELKQSTPVLAHVGSWIPVSGWENCQHDDLTWPTRWTTPAGSHASPDLSEFMLATSLQVIQKTAGREISISASGSSKTSCSHGHQQLGSSWLTMVRSMLPETYLEPMRSPTGAIYVVDHDANNSLLTLMSYLCPRSFESEYFVCIIVNMIVGMNNDVQKNDNHRDDHCWLNQMVLMTRTLIILRSKWWWQLQLLQFMIILYPGSTTSYNQPTQLTNSQISAQPLSPVETSVRTSYLLSSRKRILSAYKDCWSNWSMGSSTGTAVVLVLSTNPLLSAPVKHCWDSGGWLPNFKNGASPTSRIGSHWRGWGSVHPVHLVYHH